MTVDDDIPIGLGFELGMNKAAMLGFASLTEGERKQVIEAARGIRSREEMHSFVDSIAEIGRAQ
ncbi:MAG: hypothetical protein NC355_07800 [Blautia sp.]|nr:hypothetical protein [Blautia sp.]MCM1283811.1 hypothetical protein [Roseburia sp.]MCM1431493.1 hypothetical protein [Muribaculaceae bacterium]MCM1493213.1 hypothetical protein [Muribaculaceae bacterium]